MSRAATLVLVLGLAGALTESSRAPFPALSPQDLRARLPDDRDYHWGANLTTPELIEAFGYPVEVHHVTTDDGYILELHRIPHGVSSSSSSSAERPVVLLHHGVLSSSADWIMNTVDEALGYIMADAGYDVWLANCRGNTYSRNHLTLDPEEVEFWNFNWDEIAAFDIPADIDYILETTGASDLLYVGFSMGTTTFFAMLSEHPEYNEKIRAMVALAPVTFLGNAKGPIADLAPYTDDLDTILSLLGVGELLPSSDLVDSIAEKYCDINAPEAQICYNILFLLCGPDPDELNKEFLPVLLSHTPAGASVHTLNHFGQLVLSNEFLKYDYGLVGNLNHYGQATPPSYDLSRVEVPVGLFVAENDWLADPLDVGRLEANLTNVALVHKVDFASFNHLDFVWALHTNEYVYRYVMEFLSSFTSLEH